MMPCDGRRRDHAPLDFRIRRDLLHVVRMQAQPPAGLAQGSEYNLKV
jgi:hypothetical protein